MDDTPRQDRTSVVEGQVEMDNLLLAASAPKIALLSVDFHVWTQDHTVEVLDRQR